MVDGWMFQSNRCARSGGLDHRMYGDDWVGFDLDLDLDLVNWGREQQCRV
jgi:hypothetical protein